MSGSGSLSCPTGSPPTDDPAGLQAICDLLGPNQIAARSPIAGCAVLPVPLTAADQAAGYWWELSMRQVEVSRTLVFDRAPARPRVLRGPGRRQPRHRPSRAGRAHLRPAGPAERFHPRRFKTKVVTRGVDVTVNAFYKHSRIKQYLKDGRALRIETVIN